MSNSQYQIVIKDLLTGTVLTNESFLFNHESHKISVSLNDSSYSSTKYRTAIRWDFGDGTVIEAPTAEHYYKKAGKFTISATLYDIDRVPDYKIVPSKTIYVKEIVPNEISFIEPSLWKNKSNACYISKNNKLGSLLVTIGNEVSSLPKVSAIRRWTKDADEKSYFNIKDTSYYHLNKYYTFLEEDQTQSIDKKSSNYILRPVEFYSPTYYTIYGRVVANNNTPRVEAYIVKNSKNVTLSYFKPYSSIEGNRTRCVNTNNVVLKSNQIPEGCSEIGKIGIINIWYKNDNEGPNDLVFEFKKDTLFFKNEEKIKESYLNIPNLGISINIKDKQDTKDIISVLSPNGLYNHDNIASEDSNKVKIDIHLKHNFYKNYKIEAFYSYFIKNDPLDDTDLSYNMLKGNIILPELVTNRTSAANDCIIELIDNTSSYYKIYHFTPLLDNFKIYRKQNNLDEVIYTHGELINFDALILPREKMVEENIDELLDAYMPHPSYNEATNIKKFLKYILENNNMLSYVMTKSNNFLDDNVNYKTCYLDKFLGILEMLNENVEQYNISGFNKVNDLREMIRIMSMNYSQLFGHLIIDKYDIKITAAYKGKNVSDEIKSSDTIFCDSLYNIIGFRRDNKIYKLTVDTPFLILKDDFTYETRFVSFYDIESIEYEDFSDQSQEWLTENEEFTKKVKYVYSLNSYTYKWGWNLSLPTEVETSNTKHELIDNYYSFFLFNPHNFSVRQHNFVSDKTIPLSKIEPDKQITIDEWEKDFGFTYDCLMKVLTSNLTE